MSEIMTKPEVAELLRCSIRQVNYLVANHGLPVFHIGRSARYRRSEIEAWLKKR